MKTIRQAAAFSLLIILPALVLQALPKNANLSHLTQKGLEGDWYMGTMMGSDCNLHIDATNTLKIEFGGCFGQDPIIQTHWKFKDDKILFLSSNLNSSLGIYLAIDRYKGHVVLIPERNSNFGVQNYSYSRCFWRNLMKDGLELSKDAPQ